MSDFSPFCRRKETLSLTCDAPTFSGLRPRGCSGSHSLGPRKRLEPSWACWPGPGGAPAAPTCRAQDAVTAVSLPASPPTGNIEGPLSPRFGPFLAPQSEGISPFSGWEEPAASSLGLREHRLVCLYILLLLIFRHLFPQFFQSLVQGPKQVPPGLTVAHSHACVPYTGFCLCLYSFRLKPELFKRGKHLPFRTDLAIPGPHAPSPLHLLA